MVAPHSLSCKYPAVADVGGGGSSTVQVKLPESALALHLLSCELMYPVVLYSWLLQAKVLGVCSAIHSYSAPPKLVHLAGISYHLPGTSVWCLRLKYPAALRVFHGTAPELRADVPGGTPLKGCCVVQPSEVPGETWCCVVLAPDVPYLGCSVLTELHAGIPGGAI